MLPSYRASVPARPGGTAVLTDFEFPSSLYPLTTQTDLDMRLGQLLFAPLWGFDPQLRAYPSLARQVPTLANGGVRVARDGRSMTVTVSLVPGLRWSDGQPIVADDVIFTWHAITDPSTRARYGFDRIQAMERRSPTEVTWSLETLYPGYLQAGAAMFVLPSHRLQSASPADLASFARRPDVVSGPFTVDEFAPDDHVVFSANPQYPDGRSARHAYPDGSVPFAHRPYLERLVFTAQSGKATELTALTTGAADLGFHLLPEDLADVQSTPAVAAVVTTGMRDEFLNPNHASGAAPWHDDPVVLSALGRALDRAALVRDVTGGRGTTARGLYPRALSAGAQPALPQHVDAEGAKRLLAAAGWITGPDGVRVKEGRRLAFSLLGICGRSGLDTELDKIRRQWLAVGAAVATSCQGRDAFLKFNAAGSFDMTLYSYQWLPDPDSWAAVGVSGRPDNWNRCHDRALDTAFARGEATLDAAARGAAYQDAEREWLRYGCTIPLFEVPDVRVRSTRLTNFAPNPFAPDTWNAADWWLRSG